MATDSAVRAIDERVRELEEKLGPKLEEAKERLGDLNDKAKDFIRENPVACVAGAVVVGFLIGRLASRK